MGQARDMNLALPHHLKLVTTWVAFVVRSRMHAAPTPCSPELLSGPRPTVSFGNPRGGGQALPSSALLRPNRRAVTRFTPARGGQG